VTTPTIRFELALTDPTEDPIWLDETPYLRSFSTNRGRDNELDRSRAGQATLRVDNRDGRYVPSNTAGAHYPFMRPNRRVRLSTEYPAPFDGFLIGDSFVGDTDVIGGGASLLFYLFTGFIEDWPQTWDRGGREAEATINATDGFIGLGLAEFNLTFPLGPENDRSGERVRRVLKVMAWQPSEVDPEMTKIEDGTVMILGTFGGVDITVHEKALDHIQKVAETEGGNVFIDGTGDVCFHAADHVLDLDPTEIYGDGHTGYTDIAITTGADRIYNDIVVHVDPANVNDGRANSSTSIARYWRRSLDITLLASTPYDSIGTMTDRRASQLRDRYSQPRMRIIKLRLQPTTDATWLQVLRHEIGDVVLVRKRLPTGDTIEQVSLIEGIAFDAPNDRDWSVTWTLSAHFDEPVSLLTEAQQSFEAGITGWIAQTGCSISQSSVQFLDGESSMAILATADPAKVKTDPATAIPVTVGLDYRGIGALLIVPQSGRANLEIDWLDAAGSFLSTSVGASQSIQNRSWRFFEVEGTAPATAAYAVLRIHIHDAEIPQTVYADMFDFYPLTPTVAAPPPPDTGGPSWLLIH
jgi:hypothetical protein